MLDPYNYTTGWGSGIDAEQLAWARADLESASDKEFLVMTLHPPLITEGEINPQMVNIIQLCDDFNVDVVFFGHDHNFDYAEVNGTHYILAGIGGNNGGNAQPSGYFQVDVSDVSMVISVNRYFNSPQQVVTITA